MSAPPDRPAPRRDANDAFDAREGALARLVRAVPPFEPPPGMEARFSAQLDTFLRMTAGAEATGATAADGRAASAHAHGRDAMFEPPARLEQAVLAEAARIDAAQAPRRDAVLRDLRSDAEDALGERLGGAATAWVRAQASERAQAPEHAPVPGRRPSRTRRPGWPAFFGGAVAAVLAAGIALNLWQPPGQAPAPGMIAQVPESERAEARAKRAEAPATSAPATQAPRTQPFAPSDERARAQSVERYAPAPPSQSLGRAETAQAATAPSPPAVASRSVPSGRPPATAYESVPASPQAAAAYDAVPTPPPDAAFPFPAPAPPTAAYRQSLPTPPPASQRPAHAGAAAGAQSLRESRTSPPATSGVGTAVLTASLDDDPAVVARRLSASGHEHWTLRANSDDADAVLAWLARLRASAGTERVVLRIEPQFVPGARGLLRLEPAAGRGPEPARGAVDPAR